MATSVTAGAAASAASAASGGGHAEEEDRTEANHHASGRLWLVGIAVSPMVGLTTDETIITMDVDNSSRHSPKQVALVPRLLTRYSEGHVVCQVKFSPHDSYEPREPHDHKKGHAKCPRKHYRL